MQGHQRGLTHYRRLALLLIGALLFGPGLPAHAARDSAKTALEPLTLQLRWLHQFQFAGYYAALHKGFYRDHGLDVRIVAGAPGRNPVNEVLAGRADYGEANSELLYHYLKGAPLVALAAIFQHSPSALLTRADSGIRTPQDLAGKRIMLMGGDGSDDVDLIAMLQHEGLSRDQVHIIPSSFDINDLIEGQVDAFNAYLTNEPFFLQERDIPVWTIEPARYGVDFYSDILFTSQQELRNHPERVKAFRAATLKGWDYAMANKQEIIDLIVREYQPSKSRAHLEFEAEAMERLILPKLIPMGHINPGRFAHMADIMVQLGLAKPGYDLGDFIYDPNPKVDRALFLRATLGIGVLLLVVGLVALAQWRFNHRLSREVQQRRLTEDQLRQSERHYRSIIENLQDIYYRTDEQGRISEISPSVQSLGYQVAPLIGSSLVELFASSSAFEQLLTELQANAGRLRNFEVKVLDARGQDRWLSINCRRIDPARQDSGYEGTLRDISNRKRIEENLQQERNLAESIINSAQVIILVLDPHGQILHINPFMEQLSGFHLDDLRGRDWFETFLPDADHGRLKELFQRVLTGIDVSGQVNALVLGDGSKRWVEWYNRTLKDSDGEVIGVLSVGHDISERLAAEEQLKLAASVFTYAQEGIYITDPQGIIVDINDAFTAITGYRRDEIIGQHSRLLKSDRHPPEFYQAMWEDLTQRGSWSGEIWNRRKNGDLYPELLTLSAISDHRGKQSHYVGLFTEISEQKAYQSQLEQIAHYDSLTRLPNRVLLADRLQQAMYQVVRRDLQLAVVFIDLDGFKAVNDSHGHDTGDALLVRLAERMRATLREGDTIARLGGDEFVAVLIDLKTAQDSIPLLDRLLEAAAMPIQVDDLKLQVSASIGVTFYPQDEEVDPDQLLRQADQAMYQSKISGKNRYHLFDTETDRNTRGLHEHLETIRQALEQNQFVLYYQPKVNMRSGEVIGAEALIRWNHPQHGLLSPLHFLPVVENHPIGLALDEWVIGQSLTQMASWRAQGIDLQISVNVSGPLLQRNDFVERLEQILRAHPSVPPSQLELEVVESSALEDINQVSRIIDRCQALGVSFALDDFGTGYSSLTYLKRLPASRIKIDQTFVRDMLDDPDDLAILEGVLGMAHAFALETVAEGVETRAHGELLLQLNCPIGQGYGIGHPMPAERLPEWLRSWRPYPEWTRQVPIHRNDLPLLQATAEHKAWLRMLREFLRGERDHPPRLARDRCRFGQWLQDEGRRHHGRLPNFQALAQAHEALHKLGEESVNGTSVDTPIMEQRLTAQLEDFLDLVRALLQDIQQH